MYVENGWLSLDPIYLSLLHPHEISDNFSDMDGFQDGGYILAQGFLQYHLIKYHGRGVHSLWWSRLQWVPSGQFFKLFPGLHSECCRDLALPFISKIIL